jgi:hypothetical protein
LNELHDADLKTTTPINGHILGYNGTLWVNKTIAGWLGYTPVTNARTLTINGTAYDLSADRSWTINSMVYPSAGIAVSTGTAWGTSITDNSSNWNTAFGWGNHASAGYVPGARTLTINGTTFDLTANRSWTIDSTTAATRTIQKFTSTSNQSVFTITGGYTVGMVDVYVNGVKLDNAGDFTAANGTTVTLTDALIANQIVEVYKFGSQFIPNNALRQVTNFTATAGQTTFTVNYSVGLVDVYYNGSCLAQSEYTATNGTSIILATACQVNDIVVVYAYSYSVGAFSGIGGSGTTNFVPKFTSSSVIGNSLIFDNGTSLFIGNGQSSATPQVGIIEGTDGSGTNIAGAEFRIQGGQGTGTGVGGAVTFYTAPIGSSGSSLNTAVERMRITNAGLVGIATTSPSARLDVRVPVESPATGAVALIAGTSNGSNDIFRWFDGATQLGVFKNNGNILLKDQCVLGLNTSDGSDNGYLAIAGAGADGDNRGAYIYLSGNERPSDAGSLVLAAGNSGSNGIIQFRIGAGVERMRIFASGNIRFSSQVYGNTVASPRTLYIQSDGELGGISSIRESKTNIAELDSDWIMQLNPVSFNYRKKNEDGKYTDEYYDELFYGLIAEETELVNKEICTYNDDKLVGIEYSKLVPVLIKAIQEQNQLISDLRNEVEQLKQK